MPRNPCRFLIPCLALLGLVACGHPTVLNDHPLLLQPGKWEALDNFPLRVSGVNSEACLRLPQTFEIDVRDSTPHDQFGKAVIFYGRLRSDEGGVTVFPATASQIRGSTKQFCFVLGPNPQAKKFHSLELSASDTVRIPQVTWWSGTRSGSL
jgi:hypothetical protein